MVRSIKRNIIKVAAEKIKRKKNYGGRLIRHFWSLWDKVTRKNRNRTRNTRLERG